MNDSFAQLRSEHSHFFKKEARIELYDEHGKGWYNLVKWLLEGLKLLDKKSIFP
jgi:hypothetical protein